MNVDTLLNKMNEFVNSKHTFNYYVASQIANSIANALPKVKFKNQILNDLWSKHSLINNFLKINYEIVRKCSLFGSVFAGVIPTKNFTTKNYLPSITIGIPIEITQIGFEIVKLTLLIDIVKFNNISYFITEKWDLTSNASQFFERQIYDTAGIKINPKTLNMDTILNKKNWNPIWNKIPYVPFYANPFSQPDLANVPENLFKDYDMNLKILKTDSLINKGLAITNILNAGIDDNLIALKNAFENPEQMIIDYNGIGGIIGDHVIDIMQGHSNADSIISKLKFIESKIKQFGFIRTDTSNLGTKNATSDEVENMNADADDYLEMKANLLENSWKLFFDSIYTNYCLEIEDVELSVEEDVDVEISGSTKYLRNPKNQYIQNQNGVLTNPNDLNQKNNGAVKNEEIFQD